MGTAILIQAGDLAMDGELNDSATAEAVSAALPISGAAQIWGDEIYFSIPVHVDEEDAQATVPSGTLAYWPPGNALCIFFGQTPASPVNVIGKLLGEPTAFRAVSSGTPVQVEVRRNG